MMRVNVRDTEVRERERDSDRERETESWGDSEREGSARETMGE